MESGVQFETGARGRCDGGLSVSRNNHIELDAGIWSNLRTTSLKDSQITIMGSGAELNSKFDSTEKSFDIFRMSDTSTIPNSQCFRRLSAHRRCVDMHRTARAASIPQGASFASFLSSQVYSVSPGTNFPPFGRHMTSTRNGPGRIC